MKNETTTPLAYQTSQDQNIFSILVDRATRKPNDDLVKFRDEKNEWVSQTASEFLDTVRLLGKGLFARGIRKGDAVAILSNTRWEWTALDFAALSIGAVVVPIYQTDSPAQIKAVVNDARVKLLFVEDMTQRAKVEEVLPQMPGSMDVYVLDENAIAIFQEFGESIDDDAYDAVISSVTGKDLATIVYTSGSTGEPKGVEITHYEFCSSVYNGRESMPDISYAKNGCYLCFLPLAHIFARYMQYFTISGDMTLAISKNMKTLLTDFKETKPTLILGVPRVFEKIYNAATQKAGTGFAGRIFHRSVVTAREWSRAQQNGHIPWLLNAKRNFYKKVVYQQIIDVLGGRADFIISGGAPIDRELSSFFNGIGLPLLEGYGMTECSAPAAVNPVSGYKIGSVGRPLGGMTFAITDDDEILIAGPSVCSGYHGNPKLTAETIDADGWLHTGDLGRIDEDGFIYVTGRKKELLITAGGKNVSPGPLEASVMTSPVVDQCLVIGDRKPFIAALITLDLPGTNAWLTSQGGKPVASLDEARHDHAVLAEVQRAIDAANTMVSRAESIRKFEILDTTFTQDNGMLTPSLKAKRSVILKNFDELINTEIYVPKKSVDAANQR